MIDADQILRSHGPLPGTSYRRTDYGNAERLVWRHGTDLRHCHMWQTWLTWDGARWCHDDTGEITRYALTTVRAIYTEAASADDPDEAKALGAWASKSESDNRVRAMLSLARALRPVPVLPTDLDQHPWLLTVSNGTLDLRTGALRPHDRDDLVTKLAPVAYDPDAQAPAWTKFLDRVTDHDPDLSGYLQRVTGYCLTGDTSEQAIFIPYGNGANGKSVMLAILRALVGDYGMEAPRDLLVIKPSGQRPDDLAALRGARLVTAIESAGGQRLDESMIKQFTGDDLVPARYLYGKPFTFRPEGKLWLATNHKPQIRGTDDGIWRRIHLIPFTVQIPEAERDRHLTGKLRAELPGILAWAVRGCLDWIAGGLAPPKAVTGATEGYRREQDTLGDFLTACCTTGEGRWAYSTDLYDAYATYTGERVTRKAFGAALAEKGFDAGRIGHGGRRAWLGLGLLTPQDGKDGDTSDAA